MTLVCATHFSEAARRSATAAAMLARKLDEPLFLVHVLSGDLSRALGQGFQESTMAALREEVRRLEALGARVSHQLLTGEPAEELARFVEEKGVGLVVVAAPTSASPFLGMGGTVDRLATSISAPLLVVRDPEPFEAWARGVRPLKVLLGVERSQPFESARDWLQALRHYGPVEVVAGRIYWPHEESHRLGLAHPGSYQEVAPELVRALEQEVRTLVSPLEAMGQRPARVRVEPGMGRIADHLVALAAEEQVDLLVVGSHQRRGLGKLWSVSHHALRLAKMSVVRVPATAHGRGAAPIPVLRTVLVATDFSESANRAIAYAFSLLPTGGTVYLVTVGEGPAVTELERDYRQRLHQLVPRDGDAHGRKVQVEVLEGGEDVSQVLLQAAQRWDVDVICVGTHGRSGAKSPVMGAVARTLLSRADRPVMVVPPLEG